MIATEYNLYRESSLKVKPNNNLELFKTLLQPHFLFNSLNNLYALSISKSEKTSDAIVNLSQLLEKVVIYSTCELIPLTDEIKLIQDYIELEKTWLGECSFLMDIRVKGEIESISIPPLTLYTLVENAFKHGIRKCTEKAGWITINILVKKGRVYCKIRNACPTDSELERDDAIRSTGIGLEAIMNILNNKYKNKYILDSKQVDSVYCVDLLLEDIQGSNHTPTLKVL